MLDWGLGIRLEIGIRDWELGLEIGDWGFELGIENGN